MQLFKSDKIKPVMRNYLDEVVIYRYVLECLYKELKSQSNHCDHCDSIVKIKILLERLCDSNEVDIKLDDH